MSIYGNSVILRGKVRGKATRGIVANSSSTTLTIGSKSQPLSRVNPYIQGETCGVQMSGTLSFYNGMIIANNSNGTPLGTNTTVTNKRNSYLANGVSDGGSKTLSYTQ